MLWAESRKPAFDDKKTEECWEANQLKHQLEIYVKTIKKYLQKRNARNNCVSTLEKLVFEGLLRIKPLLWVNCEALFKEVSELNNLLLLLI